MRRPHSFKPGESVAPHLVPSLTRVGFESGYPLFALNDFDLMDVIHVLTGERDHLHRPLLRMSICIPGEADAPAFLLTPMRVAEVRRIWRSGFEHQPRWYLDGTLEKRDPSQTWRLGRLHVTDYAMHVSVDEHGRTGYAQFVPVGPSDKLPAQCEGFCWADASSRLPPDQPT
jgi:hypothetical protein